MHVAVVGTGYWGPNLVRVFNSHPQVDRLSVCDTDRSRLNRMQALYPGVALEDDLERVMADESIEAVVLALPTQLHYQATKQALQARKHVFVEKPLARTVAEAEELCGLAEEMGKVLMVGHTFLFNSAVRKVKGYVDSGDLGEVYYVYGQRLNLGIVRSDVDALWNLAPHDVSILLYWLGAGLPEEVVCSGSSHLQPGIDDVSFLILRFGNGVLGHLHVSWLDPNKVRRMTVVGSKKMVVYDDVAAEARVQLFDKGIDRKQTDRNLGRFEDFAQFQLLRRAGDLLVPKVDFVEPLQQEAAHFMNCVREGERPLSDGRNGLDVVRVLEAASRSRNNDGKPERIGP
jgi:predicted dehydrogenase